MSAAPDLRRRGLLLGGGAAAPVLRPPWALEERRFLDACTSCGACVGQCPERVLVAGAGRLPEFDPHRGECTFCGDCVRACPSGALAAAPHPWRLTAVAQEGCMPRQGIVCSSCRDACPAQAVRFPVRSRIPVPEVDLDACTGCGACVAVCPVDAIALRPRGEETA